ncbi:MAG: glycosyltransferase [Desulfobaccales bacterium]
MIEPVPILFTIPNFITAGSGRALLDILERLDRRRFAPSVCVLKKGGNLAKEVESLGIPLLEAPFAIPIRPYASLLRRAWQAARLFKAGRYRLWHSFHYSDDYTEPIIARMAGARAWIYWKKNMGWGSRAWYIRTLLATRIIALNTDMMRGFFAPRIFARKARLVPLGVDSSLFHPGIPARLNIRRRSHIPSEAIVVGCVAHLVPIKGYPTLLQALARVPDLHLLIAGQPLDQEYAASLENLVQSLGIQDRIHFLGAIKDVSALLVEMDIFVLPTVRRGEGLPVALLEAMASGRACIASDVPGSRDAVEPGKSGLLVAPENVDSLAAALNRLTSSRELRLSMGLAARERVLQNYTIEKEVAAHQAIYEELLDKRC